MRRRLLILAVLALGPCAALRPGPPPAFDHNYGFYGHRPAPWAVATP